MIQQIEESGITFHFSATDFRVWRPEISDCYKQMQGVKMADFMVERSEKKVFLVEVKTTAPRELEAYLNEIAGKLKSMVSLFTSLCWKRIDEKTEPIPVEWRKAAFLKKKHWRCVLIVKDHKDEWLTGLQDALQINKAFRAMEQLYNLQPPVCMNKQRAKEIGWIT